MNIDSVNVLQIAIIQLREILHDNMQQYVVTTFSIRFDELCVASPACG